MKKRLKKVALILATALLMLVIGAFLDEFDSRDAVMVVLFVVATFLTLLAYWL